MHRGGIQPEERPAGWVLGRKISLHRRRERPAEAEQFSREPEWTEPVAVGSEGFVREVAGRLGRRRIEVAPVEEDEQSTWRAQEVSPRYV